MAQYFISFPSCVENSECATKRGYDSPAKESYHHSLCVVTGADPGFFLGGGALVSCSTSTQQVFAQTVGGTPYTLPLDPPLSY